MQIKILSFFLFSLSILSLTSCHKDNVASSSDKLVAKMIINNAVTGYTYDAQKRIIKEEKNLSDTVKASTTVYDYSQANKIIVTFQNYFPNASSNRAVYKLNASGKAEVFYSTNSISADINDTSSSYVLHFIYNADGQIGETYEISNDGTVDLLYFTYTNGNLTKIISTVKDKNGIETGKGGTDYIINSTITNTIDNDHFGQSFRGKGSKNVFSASTQTAKDYAYNSSKTFTFIANYTYDVDSNGYITKATSVGSVDGGTPKTYVKSYVYQ